jgi:flagellar protein FliO/FliZ
MANFIWYALLSVAAAIAIVGAVWIVRGYLNGTPPRISFFGPRAEPRLAVVDHANVDGRRRLVLVRRDNIEHLIMTGGPVDVVIETGIPSRPVMTPSDAIEATPPAQPPTLSAQPVYTRSPRTLGAATAGAADGTSG